MLQYIKGLAATLNKLYIKVQFKMINTRLERFEKKYKVEKKA